MPLYPISCSFCGSDITSNKDHAGHITNHQNNLSDLQSRLTTVVLQYFEDGPGNGTGDCPTGNSALQRPAMFHGDPASPVLTSRRRFCNICKRIIPKQYNMTRHTYQHYNWRLQCVQCGKKPINADAYIYHSCDGMKPDTEERKSRIQFVDDKLAEQQRTDDRPSMIECQPATEGLTTAAMMVQEPVHQAAGLSAKDDSAIHASQYQRESIWTQPGQDLALYFDYGEEARRAACEGAGQNPPIGAVPFDRVSLWQAPM